MTKKQEPNYKDTLNLPKTAFPMRGRMKQREKDFQKAWEEADIYGQVRAARTGAPKFILHDGPPYPTGDIHIGTGMNKVLKDIIVKYKTMQGFDAPFIPGWDCHGLPIEYKVLSQLGEKAAEMPRAAIRKRCRDYAMKFVERNRRQFKSLGIFGRWEKPYLTLNPEYEAAVIEGFADVVEGGYVTQALKPVHWCFSCRTVLAEAELEYSDEKSPSIYVKFAVDGDYTDLFPQAAGYPTSILIWTTTPWTLPANLAIAVHPDADYTAVLYDDPNSGRREALILAEALVDAVFEAVGISGFEPTGVKVKGRDLENRAYRHPFVDRVSPVISARYVSLSDGTGAVHNAPGHGHEDFTVCREYGIDPYCPVDPSGRFTEEAGKFAGKNIFDANPLILQELRRTASLLHQESITHSYPHCWRCKKPVIFRATEQWFILVDHNDLRDRVLEEIDNVEWIPDWGKTRITSMVSERPDWCISRQKSWGLPIPAFYCKSCGATHLDPHSIRHVAKVFREKGSTSWFELPAETFLPEGTTCAECGGGEFRKETDIFDVWFESGSSQRAVLRREEGLTWPADLYLEGTDQHRGWFQLSLIPAVAAENAAPYRAVLTHGFVVDEEGRKMSKSLGNFLSVEDALKEFGAEITRLWVSSVNFRDDIKVSRTLIGNLSDAYRRIRNTFRYFLGNLADFDPAADAVADTDLAEIDRWALAETAKLVDGVTRAYEGYQFHRVYHLVHNFCVVEMSSFYLDILKDRLYCEARTSVGRRAAQTVLYRVLQALVKVLAPVLIHTAEEVWQVMPGEKETPSVHLARWPKVDTAHIDDALAARWERMIAVRDEVQKNLEALRAAKTIGGSLEASVTLYTEDADLYEFIKSFESDLETILIVSEAKVVRGTCQTATQAADIPALYVEAEVSQYRKCARCWNFRESVGTVPSHEDLCRRCANVVDNL